jgi:calcineurin-like phosphoesterase family protein
MMLRAAGYDFLLLHDPKDRPPGWQGWIIHGHTHNNDMHRYPFINGEQRTINVSVELVDYRPVSLTYLLSLDLRSIRRMPTINDEPERLSTRL